MSISNVISLLSGVALFLFGMTLMGDGLKNVAGNKLEIVLYNLTGTSFKSVLLGTAVTAVIQSSSATSVMVVGFVNAGIMQLTQAIGIILGSTLGTSITGWVVCLSELGGDSTGWVSLFSTSTITGVVAVIGIILTMFSKKKTHKHIGSILMGFAVLMFGMSTMSGSVAPLRTDPGFVSILTSFSNPFIGILVGIAFACILQSASAAVGILQVLSLTGVISFAAAFPIIMGIAIGAGLPVVLSSIGANVNARRSAWVYVLISVVSVVVVGAAFYIINAFAHFSFTNQIMSIVDVAVINTVFRLFGLIVLYPFINLLANIITNLIKDSEEEVALYRDLERLEERFIAHPALAVEQARFVINSMARLAKENFFDADKLMDNYSEEGLVEVKSEENVIDKYEDRLGTYLMKITEKELTKRQNEDISKFLHTLSDFERISDHALNVGYVAQEIDEKAVEFSVYAVDEVNVLKQAVLDILEMATEAFINNDIELANRVEPLDETIRLIADQIKFNHIERLQKGQCTLQHGFVLNDLLTNYERVADHCSNIAVAVIELATDSFDTHEYLKTLKSLKEENYDKYLNEYSEKYKLPE